MRLFIAGNLPANVRDAIHADAAVLRDAAPAVRWVAAPSLHITLKFLGECDERVIDDPVDKLIRQRGVDLRQE